MLSSHETQVVSRALDTMLSREREVFIRELAERYNFHPAIGLAGTKHVAAEQGCDVAKTGEASGARRGALTLENVDRVFTYQAWDREQISRAEPVKEAILALARAILRNVIDCPDRSVALRKLRELRMDVNAAITHRGEF